MTEGTRTGHPRGGATGLALATFALLGACDGGQLPPDAALTISPTERSIRVTEYRDVDGVCRTDGSRFVDVPMLLHLAGVDGSPIEGAAVDVYVDFAANTWSGLPVLALYEDRNGNGIVDADSELASGEGDSIARVRTDDDGAYRLLLRADIACPYRGEVFAHVGGTYAQASFEVVAAETVQPEPVVTETPAPRPPGDDDGPAPEPATDADADADADASADPGTGAGADDGTTTDEPDGTGEEDATPFDTLPEDGTPEDDASGDGSDDAQGSPDVNDTTGEPTPQPVHCIDAAGRRTTIVCTVDREPGS